ncbi:MAG: GNAT family N-acetyltransferase [Pseudomonadota bacterium]
MIIIDFCGIEKVLFTILLYVEQRKGYGTVILKQLVALSEKLGCKKIILNARTTATKFYEKQGFTSSGGEFLSKSTGVPHVQMHYKPNIK